MKMSSNHRKTDFQLPSIKICDFEFWLNSVELILSTEDFCDNLKYNYVNKYLQENGYGFLVEDLPKSSFGAKYKGLRDHILGEINDKFKFDPTIKGIAFFRCLDLKPSAFLNVLNKVYSCDHAIPKSFTRMFLLARLPRHIQKLMFATVLLDPKPLDDKSPKELAETADGITAYLKYHSLPRSNKPKVTLPEYVTSDPELWFYSLEAAFSQYLITDDQLKFEYTMEALQTEEIVTAALFLTDLPNLPTENRYANLKERVLKAFSLIQIDKIYSFVFRNMKGLRPKSLLQFIKNMVAKTDQIVPELLIRTFWIMLLPIQTQAVLFELLIKSREPLQDLDMNALVLVADGRWRDIESNETMTCLVQAESAADLDNCCINEDHFQMELKAANTCKQKIAVGVKYCDFMYRSYYLHSQTEVRKCTVYTPQENSVSKAEHYWFEGCACTYHEKYGKKSKTCMRIVINPEDSD